MKPFVILVIAMTFFGGCKKSTDGACTGYTFYYFYNNKKIDTNHVAPGQVFTEIVAGQDIVFDYSHSTNACNMIADAGFVDHLVFEIPAGTSSFEYNDAASLQTANAYFTRTCFCANVTSRPVTGSIKGVKLSASQWNIIVNVTEPVSNMQLSFTKNFQLF